MPDTYADMDFRQILKGKHDRRGRMKNNVRTPRMFRGEKRILSFLLILAMVFAVIPNSVVRAEDEINKDS